MRHLRVPGKLFVRCDFLTIDKDPSLSLLPQRRSTSLPQLGSLLTLLVHTLGQQLSILVSSILGSLRASSLECDSVSLVLHSLRSDESLDLGGLGVWLGALLLGDDFTADDELANIILLAQTEESSDLGGTLGTEALGVDDIGEAWDFALALLDDGQSKDRQVLADDAATDGLALALAITSGSVAGVAFGKEELDTGREHDTLLHGKALLVITAGDAENVALPLITETVSGNFVAHTLLHEDAQLALIVNLEELLRPIGRVGDVQLHLVGWLITAVKTGGKP